MLSSISTEKTEAGNVYELGNRCGELGLSGSGMGPAGITLGRRGKRGPHACECPAF